MGGGDDEGGGRRQKEGKQGGGFRRGPGQGPANDGGDEPSASHAGRRRASADPRGGRAPGATKPRRSKQSVWGERGSLPKPPGRTFAQRKASCGLLTYPPPGAARLHPELWTATA